MSGFVLPAHQTQVLESNMRSAVYTAAGLRAEAFGEVLSQTRQLAQQDPRWAPLADEIDVWDEHDRTWIGVRGANFQSQAFEAEYGSGTMAPSGLMRTLDEVMTIAGRRVSERQQGVVI